MDVDNREEAAAALKKRSPNYTSVEKEHLFNIIDRYKSIIENKKTDAVSVKCKKETWQKICNEFNSLSPNLQYRPVDSLKKFYEKQKEELRKRYANKKKELYRTGGGPEVKNDNKFDDLLMSIVNEKSVKGLGSCFDSNSVPQDQSCEVNITESNKEGTVDDCTVEIVYVENNLSKPEELQNDWKHAESLKKPVSRELQENVQKVNDRPTKRKCLDTKTTFRRRPTTIVPLTSSILGEKYNLLIDKKLELVECLKQEHLLRMESLQLDITLKKKQLGSENRSPITNLKDSSECLLDSQVLF